jgi:molybdate transport system substrate-binding protein
MRIIRYICLIMVIFSIGCVRHNRTDTNREIKVSAAISLKDAFTEIGILYENRNGIRVIYNFGASGVLQKQIEAAAPVDIFASASEKQMNELSTKDLIDQESRRDFAKNRLVLIVPNDSPLKLSSFEDLNSREIKRIAIGNPKTVPVGQYSYQLLENLKILSGVKERIIEAENVRQVLDYVMRGEVDAGIVYASDIIVAKGRVQVAIEAPLDKHDPIIYPIAVIKDSKEKEASRKFIDLLLSEEGQAILKNYQFKGIR